MNILGISAPLSWNPAAAIIKNKKLLAIAEEERFIGVKHAPRMLPLKSIEYCLKEANLKLSEIDYLALGYRSPSSGYFLSLIENTKNLNLIRAVREVGAFSEYGIGMIRLKDWLNKKGFQGKIIYIPHHLAHAASAYRCSGFEEANIITIDGQGEDDAGFLGYGKEGKISREFKIGHQKSLGWVYSEFTDLLGFTSHSHEGKVMGLAGWGKKVIDYSDLFEVSEYDYRLKKDWYKKLFEKYGPRRNRNEELTAKHKDLAKTVQDFTEKAGISLVKKIYQKTGIRNFCLAGGVALNCDMNSKIAELDFVDNIFIQPASNDAGTAIGAALECAHLIGENSDFKMEHAYWGPEYSDEEIEKMLIESKLKFKKSKNIEEEIAKYLADGKIVAWCQGRMELGPRALGNRSILGNPSLKGMKDKINNEVKHREVWRPFAPSILEEEAEKYFENYISNPFMLITLTVKKDKRDKLKEAMHIDNTARIQSVSKKTNPRYHKLISEFFKLTGIPVLINTSFNDEGQPIVNTPKEAVKTFYSTGIDILALGNFILTKEK
jgi:carbamoyltransferase